MLVTRAPEISLWEAVLPEEVLRLPEELSGVDALLDDPAFFAPFVPFFHPLLGRPSTPMETYLRMMFLKCRYRLGYESLCREVSDSITWRRFCRIPLDGSVPHSTTLMKLTTRCGTAAVQGCNEALLAKAAQAKLLRTGRVRADTTVVEADVAYPTDSGLLAKAITRIAATGARIQSAGGAGRTRVRDRSRAAGRRAHAIATKLRLRGAQAREQGQRAVRRITGELADLAEHAVADAQRLLDNCWITPAVGCARRGPGPGGRPPQGSMTRPKVAGSGGCTAPQTTSPACWPPPAGSPPRPGNVSPAAPRPGSTGGSACTSPTPARSPKANSASPSSSATRPRSSTILDNDDGVVLDHALEQGNPADAPQLAPGVERIIRRTGRRPRLVTADRGYGEATVDEALHDLCTTWASDTW